MSFTLLISLFPPFVAAETNEKVNVNNLVTEENVQQEAPNGIDIKKENQLEKEITEEVTNQVINNEQESVSIQQAQSSQEQSNTEEEILDEDNTTEQDNQAIEEPEENGPIELNGMALANPTNVYAEQSTSSNILKSYKPGLILKFEEQQKSDFYKATVYISGVRHTGYILKTDVQVDFQQESLQGFAGKSPTKIYADPDENSNVVKTYTYGRILKYRSFTPEWHVATVYVNGKKTKGYINANDVGASVKAARGVALKKVNVYKQTSTKSEVLKSYASGKILKFQPYNNNWYKATVYVKGVKYTGYIYAKDVDTIFDEQQSVSGIGTQIPTKVFATPSTSSKVLKSYKQGHNLKYRTFSPNWYEATVYVNGKKQTGYIKKSHTGTQNTTLSGYALKHSTVIYSNASTNSSKLKTYKKGTLLKYKAYNNNWFQATVYVNGKKRTGYINKSDVGVAPNLRGIAQKSPTKVYSDMSTKSGVLKSYKKGTVLKYKPYTREWFKATVYVNGKKRTGYIYYKDVKLVVSDGNTKIVNPHRVYSYNQMVRDIKSLHEAYPELISYKVIGKSEYGRDIYAVSLGTGKANAFINGSHHAREWLTTNLNMYMIEEYAKAYYKNQKIDGYDAKSILNQTTIWFVPMVNPDGVTLQQQGLKAFPSKLHKDLIKMNNGSKNFKRWKANAKGVDLNRQYNAGWLTIRSNPGKPYYKNFKGYKPESAAETKAIIKFVNEINPEMSVSYHSSGKIIFWNYLQDKARYNRDHNYAKKLRDMTGYSLVYPVGIPSGGGFNDWFLSKKKKPGFTIEISRYVGETNPPLSEFPIAWRENKAVGLFIAQESAKLYKK